MKLYQEYEVFKLRLSETQMRYNKILSEKENLFARTQPQGINFGDRVSGGEYVNAFDRYLIDKEKSKIDERLAEVKSILDDRKELMSLKEEEIRSSKDPECKIYCLRYIDRVRVYKIPKMVSYSEAQVYRFLNIIKKSIDEVKNDRK